LLMLVWPLISKALAGLRTPRDNGVSAAGSGR